MSLRWSAEKLLSVVEELRRYGDDTSLVEVKRASGGLPGLEETTCAFANMPEGGTIVLGVDEAQDFALNGVDNPAEMIQGLISQTRELVEPSPHIDAYPVDIEGAVMVVAQVSPLAPTQKPARVKSVAYLRQGDGDYAMNPNDLHMLSVESLHRDERQEYDAAPAVGTSVKDLDEDLTAQYIQAAQGSSRRLAHMEEDQLLRVTHVVNESAQPTVAGLYALGAYPQGTFPALGVTAAVRMPRESGERTRNLRHFDGPVPALLEEIMEWVEQNLSVIQAYRSDGHMENRPELPLSAIREVVSNALVHRDLGPDTLGVGKRVEIRITPKAFIVESPGGLRGLSREQLASSDLAKAAVNQRLYELAKRLRTSEGSPVIEGEGGGMGEVYAAMDKYGLEPPQLFDNGMVFRVLLRRAGVEKQGVLQSDVDKQAPQKMTRNGPAIVEALRVRARTLDEIVLVTGLSVSQARYALGALIRQNIVEMVGTQGDRGTRYRLL